MIVLLSICLHSNEGACPDNPAPDPYIGQALVTITMRHSSDSKDHGIALNAFSTPQPGRTDQFVFFSTRRETSKKPLSISKLADYKDHDMLLQRSLHVFQDGFQDGSHQTMPTAATPKRGKSGRDREDVLIKRRSTDSHAQHARLVRSNTTASGCFLIQSSMQRKHSTSPLSLNSKPQVWQNMPLQ